MGIRLLATLRMLAGIARRSGDRAEIARIADLVLALSDERIENSRDRGVLKRLKEDVDRALG